MQKRSTPEDFCMAFFFYEHFDVLNAGKIK